MSTWEEFAELSADLADFGHARLNDQVAYLATSRAMDHWPRVHPVTVLIRFGRMYVRMYPSSPKVADLLRDDRYALHSLVTDNDGSEGEFTVAGRAARVDDPEVRERVMADLGGSPSDYVLVEFSVERAMSTIYEGDREIRQRWRSGRDG